MKIVCHRGYWLKRNEANTWQAFERAVEAGYGFETDVRDCQGDLVIAHDPARVRDDSFEQVLRLVDGVDVPLALNIKADGLADAISSKLRSRHVPDWYVFDMSVPDMRGHFRAGNPVYGRLSEVETELPWRERLAGVWLDGFESLWYSEATLRELLDAVDVCVVSPELHGRSHLSCWELLKPLAFHPRLALCTDLPADADNFFNGRSA